MEYNVQHWADTRSIERISCLVTMIRSQLTNLTVGRLWLRYVKNMSFNTSYCFSVHTQLDSECYFFSYTVLYRDLNWKYVNSDLDLSPVDWTRTWTCGLDYVAGNNNNNSNNNKWLKCCRIVVVDEREWTLGSYVVSTGGRCVATDTVVLVWCSRCFISYHTSRDTATGAWRCVYRPFCTSRQNDVSSFMRPNFVVLSLGIHSEQVC